MQRNFLRSRKKSRRVLKRSSGKLASCCKSKNLPDLFLGNGATMIADSKEERRMIEAGRERCGGCRLNQLGPPS